MAKRSDSKVRLFVGTRKGAYVLESDTGRRRWKVRGPFQPGGDVFHVVADPRRPGDVYAAVNNGWFGPMLFRATQYGVGRWTELAPPLLPRLKERPAPGPDGPPVRPITNLWHLEPGRPEDPDTIYLGVDPASLYRSDDRGASWSPVAGLNEHPTRPKWNPGAGGMCLHTILWDPSRPKRMYVGISAAGTFRTDDGGATFAPKNVGVRMSFAPDPVAEVGQCVHHVVMDSARPERLYRQDHDGIYVSRDSADTWQHIGRPLKGDFGFVTVSPRSMPGTAFFVPLPAEGRTCGARLQVYRWTEDDRKWTPMLKGTPFPGQFGTHREGLAADALDPAGLYLGTTTGQLFYSWNAGRSWGQVPYAFPGIHSVTASSPAS